MTDQLTPRLQRSLGDTFTVERFRREVHVIAKLDCLDRYLGPVAPAP